MISQSLIRSNFDYWYYFVKLLAHYHLSFCLPVKLAAMSPATINAIDWKIIIQKSSARALHMTGLVKQTVSCFIRSWCLTRNAGLNCMKLLLVMMAQKKVTVLFPVEDNSRESSHHPMWYCLTARSQGGTTGWGFAPLSLYTYEQYRVSQAWKWSGSTLHSWHCFSNFSSVSWSSAL